MPASQIVNPVDLNLGQNGSPNDLNNSLDAANQLDAGQIGQQIQQGMNSVRSEAQHAAGSAAQQAVAPLTQSVAELQAELRQMGMGMQQQQTEPVEDQYSQAELDEMGDILPSVIDRRAAYQAGKLFDAAMDRVNKVIDDKLAPLSGTIQELEAHKKIQTSRSQEQFTGTVKNLATSNGLDPNAFATDQDWQRFLGETYDEIFGTTYNQVLNHAVQGQNDAIVDQVFKRFVNKYRGQQMDTASPSGGARVPAHTGDVPAQSNQRVQQIQTEMGQLRDKAKRQQISQVEFAQEINRLSAELEKLTPTE